MPGITVLGHPYPVKKPQGSVVKIQLGVNWWIIKKRNKGESDAAMQARVCMEVDELLKAEVRPCRQ
jgi:hypothetical protein